MQNPAFRGFHGTYLNFLKFLFFIYLFFVLAYMCTSFQNVKLFGILNQFQIALSLLSIYIHVQRRCYHSWVYELSPTEHYNIYKDYLPLYQTWGKLLSNVIDYITITLQFSWLHYITITSIFKCNRLNYNSITL